MQQESPLKKARTDALKDSALRPPNMEGALALRADVTDAKAEARLTAPGRIYEYTSAANPTMKPVPVLLHPASLHEAGPSRVIPFDLSEHLGIAYRATSPNLMASFIRVCQGESLATTATATSQAFYVIKGKGASSSEYGAVPWATGDMVCLPRCPGDVTHTSDPAEDSVLYWVTDEPLLQYLGVAPTTKIFEPTVIRREDMLREVERVSHEPGVEHRNRMGILLGNKATDFANTGGSGTLTLTPTLWSLLNVLPAHDAQRPHKHNSVALDLAVHAAPQGVYTLMGPELDAEGNVKDPVRCDWSSGSVFCTPPGWWHSHHNDSDEPAWVLPMQDAGLYTYQRTLDIQFVKSASPGVSATAAAEDA